MVIIAIIIAILIVMAIYDISKTYEKENRNFLGTAYYDEEKKMLVPDKIFQR